MKSRVLFLITFLCMIGTSLISQVSFYALANLQHTNYASVELDKVFVSRYLTALTLDEHFLVAGVVADTTYYQVYNIMGQKVMSGSLSTHREINISNLPSGFYLLLLDNQPVAYKFVR